LGIVLVAVVEARSTVFVYSLHPPRCYRSQVSPTVFRYRNYRFYFFSREEPRMHVHVLSPDGEAKFWLEPVIELALNKGLNQLNLLNCSAS
jgi:hypothetical protein